MRRRCGSLTALRAACFYGFLGLPGIAQTQPTPPEDPLFEPMLKKPADFDAAAQYAVSTAKAGDLEASIGALERLLFFNPQLARVRFEIGALYFRLGSFEMARGYFETAQNSADATDELKQRAQEYILVIDQKLQPDQWAGFLQTGFRYQTNATFGPNQQSLLGATRPINSQFLPRSDGNWFGFFNLNYAHDFGTQNGDLFEASLSAYDAQQFTATAVDTGALDFRAGPRFGLPLESLSGVSIKPYAALSGATLADAAYVGSFGGGVTARFTLAGVAFDPYVEVRRANYRNSTLYPFASELDGRLIEVGLPAWGQITSGIRWQARFAYSGDDCAVPWYSYDRYAFDFWLPLSIPSLWRGPSWTLTPSFGVAPWLYRQPDPVADPFKTERDVEWRVGLGLDVPIEGRFGIGLQVQYRTLISNIPGNTVKDFSTTIGPTISF
ncbi:MAG TPA: tetratricopeptide repeat protein [Methylocella sp.]|nr:tetratricopeptide repeat protein [Methylocella sp.]